MEICGLMKSKSVCDQLVDIPGAAAYLGISEISMRRLVSSGSIEHARIGRLLKFRQSALDAFVRSRTQPALNDQERATANLRRTVRQLEALQTDGNAA